MVGLQYIAPFKLQLIRIRTSDYHTVHCMWYYSTQTPAFIVYFELTILSHRDLSYAISHNTLSLCYPFFYSVVAAAGAVLPADKTEEKVPSPTGAVTIPPPAQEKEQPQQQATVTSIITTQDKKGEPSSNDASSTSKTEQQPATATESSSAREKETASATKPTTTTKSKTSNKVSEGTGSRGGGGGGGGGKSGRRTQNNYYYGGRGTKINALIISLSTLCVILKYL